MSYRDLLVVLAVVLTLPASYRRPFVGLLVFSWLAYMRPQDLCWGFARTMRLSFVVAITMVAGWYANERGRRPFAAWDFRTRMMVLLGILVTVSYMFARTHDEYTNTYFVEYVKIIGIALFTTGQVDSRQRLRGLVWMIALSLGFFGIKGGLFGLLTGGARILRGPGGMLEDNNDFALALVMNVPLLWYLGVSERTKPLALRGTRAAVLLTVITVVLTHSRGGFLALCTASLWIAWRSGKLFRAAFVLLALGMIFPLVAPKEVLDRLSTLSDPTKESSAAARFTAWSTALRMIEDNPALGVGMRNFHTRYPDYTDEISLRANASYVAHNSYLQIWAESGTFAFVVYLLLLFSVFAACRTVYRIGRSDPRLAWLLDYGRMMEATTVGFLVGAFFLNRGHFDLVYHWLSLVTALLAVATSAYRRAPEAATNRAGRRALSVRWRGTPVAAGAARALSWQRPGRWR